MRKEFKTAGSDCCGVSYYVSGWSRQQNFPELSCFKCHKKCGAKLIGLKPVSAKEMKSRIHSGICQIAKGLKCNCKK